MQHKLHFEKSKFVSHPNIPKKWFLVFLTVFSFFLLQVDLLAQEKNISGTIISAADGITLPGVNIVIKGTEKGTITDVNGKFSISASPLDVLVISFIGYQTQEMLVGDRLEINVSLAEGISELDEVVVIGYGTQKKKLVTGATDQVKGEDLQQRNTLNTIQALQGMTPGVNVTSTSGQPGEDMKVTIRGLGTIGDAAPLYLVDGVPTGDIDFLNPADIESIDVLKDAASAAIYGNRGANGVILITTRTGKRTIATTGKPGNSLITFDAYYGIQNREKKIRMLNSEEYATIMNEQYLNSGGSPSKLPFDINNLPAYTADGNASTDWLDEMFVSNAVTQNYVLGMMGANEISSYSMSMSYTGQEGIVGGSELSDYNRFGGRINSEHYLYKDRIKIGENLNFAYVQNNGISVGNQYDNTLRSAFNSSPLLPVYDDNGEFFNTADNTILDQNGEPYWNDQEANPYASMYYNNQNDKNSQKMVGNIFAEINILKNLQFRTALGLDQYSRGERDFTPIYQLSVYSFSNFSKTSQTMEKSLALNFDNLLTYNYESGVHRIVAMAGMTVYKYNGTFMYSENTDLAFNDLAHAYLNNATNVSNAAQMKIQGKPNDEDKLLSYFGRVQYDLKETYLLNATFRADGSSKFAEGNRWGYFPSVSAGWIITNEPFMSGVNRYLDFLKIRASWGQNGSCKTDPFNYLAPIKFTQAAYVFGDEEGVSENGSYPSRLSNENLKWETSEQLNIGFDSRLLKSQLQINFDWYRKLTKDWLIKAPVYATAGTDAPYINGGNVINSGVELALTYNGNAGDFNYQVNGNGAYNKNEVTDIPTEDGIIHGAINTLYNNSSEFYRAESGHAIGYFWGWETDGLFQTTTEVSQHVSSAGTIIQPNAKPGDLRYVDQNDDGVIDDLDKIDLGDPIPNFLYGVNFSCNYKGIDFLLIATGVAGNQIVQSYRGQTDKYSNYSTEILDRWTGTGTSTTIPRVTNNNINYKFSDIFVKNGSYLRISNVTLGYDLIKVIKIKFMSQLRIYFSVQNLYTFTKYSGMDPEVGYGFDNGATDKFSSGIDLGFYPHPRTMLLGVNVKF
jgi:TonB-dependent starch-binding outer membrane protein SusC